MKIERTDRGADKTEYPQRYMCCIELHTQTAGQELLFGYGDTPEEAEFNAKRQLNFFKTDIRAEIAKAFDELDFPTVQDETVDKMIEPIVKAFPEMRYIGPEDFTLRLRYKCVTFKVDKDTLERRPEDMVRDITDTLSNIFVEAKILSTGNEQ